MTVMTERSLGEGPTLDDGLDGGAAGQWSSIRGAAPGGAGPHPTPDPGQSTLQGADEIARVDADSPGGSNALIEKLRGHGFLPHNDIGLLAAMCGDQRDVPAQFELVREGEKPGPIVVVLDGWACRSKLLPDGSRQITAFLMPGDCCDLRASVLRKMEHSISTLTPARVALIPRRQMEELIESRAPIARAFWWTQLVDEDTLRAWIVSMGRRNSLERVAHLMCELYVRARNSGLTDDESLNLPLTQVVLGDALGLTPVHVNRVLRRLRLNGAMELDSGMLVIRDISKLAAVAGFAETFFQRRLLRRTA